MSSREQHEKSTLEREEGKSKRRMLGQDAKGENKRKQPDRKERDLRLG